MIPNVNRGVSTVRARNSTLPTRWPSPGRTTIGCGSGMGAIVARASAIARTRRGRRARAFVWGVATRPGPRRPSACSGRGRAARTAAGRGPRRATQPEQRRDGVAHGAGLGVGVGAGGPQLGLEGVDVAGLQADAGL